uniref:Histone-lysine N-methyltransferase n=1 Tax=Cyprinus carpio TaxID=7962 RepID=A0A8C2KZB7_CYPCA
MAHSCRWRFPARPGGSSSSGTGRKAGRIRVNASIRNSSGTDPNANGLGPGFDAALQVSATIGGNLQKFRDVLGESSGSSSGEEEFGGFSTVGDHRRIHSPGRTSIGSISPEKKPRGRPPRALAVQRVGTDIETAPLSLATAPKERVKRPPGRPPGTGEKRRGRPPDEDREKRQTLLGSGHHQGSEAKLHKISRESKVTKLKRLRDVKLSPLKSKLKAIERKSVPVPGSGVQRRRRGRPPSAERLKLRASHPADERTSPDPHDSPMVNPMTPTKHGRPLGLRQSPRHIKPVRVVPSSKRTDATIAKQLLQRAKKGAQKKKLLEKETIGTQGTAGLEGGKHRRRTQLTNIRQFIMPVVSTVSLRIIKTPKRFIEDEGSFSTPPPHMKIARLDSAASAPAPQPITSPTQALVSTSPVTSGTTATPGAGAAVDSLPPPPPPVPTGSANNIAASLLNSSCNNSTSNGRFSSSAASCGSSAVSQHSSQLSSGESSRSSSPSLDDSSCDSQASEGTQALSEEADHSPASQGETEASMHHTSHPPSPPSEPEPDHVVLMERSRRGRRSQSHRRGALVTRGRGSLIGGRKQAIIHPATGVLQAGSQQASSTASSSSSPPPPPLLSPPQPPQAASSNASEHHSHSPWMMSHSIAPFLPTPPILSSSHDKRRSILREPTFRWKSLSCAENKYFSSAKYAKEGLIRKPTFDNFRPPPLTAEDVGLMPPGPGGGGVAPGGFPHPSSRFETPKRSPLLRPPFFTPSPAHSRIFESVTLPSSSGSSPGSLSPLQVSPTSNKKRKGSKFSRGQPRSPSHSMTTRSSQSGVQTGKASEQSMISSSVPISVSGNSSPLPGVAVSPLAASALTQASFSGFPSGSIGLTSHGVSDGRRAAGVLGVSGSSASSSQLFPLFTPSNQGSGGGTGKAGRERSISATRDTREKDREMEKNREREKENKRDGRKDWDKRGKSLSSEASPNSTSSLFAMEARDIEESLTQKRTPGRKKSVTVDSGAEASPSDSAAVPAAGTLSSKGRLAKKGRPSEKSIEAEGVEREKDKEKLSSPTQAGQMGKPPATTSLGSMLARAEKQPVTDRRVAGLLRKAKAQLNKIEKREVQPGDQPKLPGQESDSSETSVRGPRIKHVCRRAAVALGRNRAVFPDDMPTLSALPWEEREKILSSMGNDDKSSVAGSEEAEPPTPPIKPVTRQKTVHEAPPRKGRRSRRCGQCPGCQVPNDCGVCTNCLDKPKFGGRNIKKQCCKVRKCQNLQWMPSKFLQKQAKGQFSENTPFISQRCFYVSINCLFASTTGKKDRRRNKSSDKKDSHHKSQSPSSPASSPKDPLLSSPSDDPKHSQTPLSSAFRKERKQQPSSSPTPVHIAPSSPPAQSQQSLQQQSQEKQIPKCDRSTLNSKSTPSTRGTAKQKAPCDGVHRIRVDFKEDYDIENVWEMGGLSILTSVPITPRVVCFLCASSGNVEFVFCQVCCEPFHLFCLGETERPHEEQWENWCCRRCRFCLVCGRQYQKTKQLLECDKCRNSYHPECLGPNHPTRPTKKKRVWICTKCVRCKSCGATKPGKAWDAQWSHDFSLCHDCAKLLAKGNVCPLCSKCYDDDDCDSKMMKCRKCDCWVHANCESLTDDMYEVLSYLPETVAYTCANCTEPHPAEWRTVLEKEIQKSMRQVLTALLNSRTSTHLLRYRQAVMKPPELNPETEESLPSRRSPEGPDPPVLTEVSPPNDSPLDLESVKKKMDSECYKSVLEFSDDIVKIIQTAINSDGGQLESRKANSMLKSYFIRQMERTFPWYKVKESKFWEARKVSPNSGLLPNAVLPPSLDHNYAQWQEREEIARAEQPVLMKKIIPAPHPKAPGKPDSPIALTPLPPPPMLIHDHSLEDSPDIPPPPGIGDNRQCALCLNYGDENTNDCGRLLYIGQNEWTHVNCALWSSEVFEDVDGALKNVHMAVRRGKKMQCENCHKPGATVNCCLTSCTNNYHFMCARQQKCAFLEDKKVYCQHHRDLIKGEVVPESGFEVTRRVLVDFEGISLRRKFVNGLESDNIHMMIGSMTIDCLGMLTELSDCERKLFPVGYQCSRVYWSTLDARKRCVYKCRILVCRPSMTETINNTAAQEENHTIAHSPPPLSDSTKPSNVPFTPKPRVYFRNRHPSYPPCHRSPSTRPLPSPGRTHEIVTVGDPLLSSTLRSIGSRRHSTSSISAQQSRQKVSSPQQGGTVSIQTGKLSAPLSSTSKETLTRDTDKGRAPSGERSHNQEANTVNTGAQRRLSFGFTERIEVSREATKKQSDGESLKSLQPVSISQVSPPLGTAVLTGHQRGSGSLKTEKGKQSTKDTDLPAGVTFMSSHPLASLSKDKANPVKEGNVTSKDTGKTVSPQPVYSKSGSRKSHCYASGPAAAAAMKPLFSSGAKVGEEDLKRGFQTSAAVTASLGTSSTKEKHSKVKMNVSRDVSKERKESAQNPVLNSNSKSSNVKTQGQGPPPHNTSNKAAALSSNTGSSKVEVNKFDQKEMEKPFKSKERFSFEKKHSSAMDAIQPKAGSERGIRPPQVHPKSSKEVTPVVKKHTERLPLMSQKMDPNGTKAVSMPAVSNTNTYTSVTPSNQGPQKRSSRAMVFSPSASSESSESDSHIHPDYSEEHVMDHQCADDGEDHNLEDEGSVDKHHEEDSDGSAGSAKRRYPRRSARARSNMFFGLTPFYGVRSYGEEDIPFYRTGEISMKKRTGSSKRSAEGQVDGADDMSTSSSADSGEDEEGGIGSNKDAYYYNFTRTIINPNSGLPPINLELQQIGQLDGVDDGSESDVSISTSSTTTATTSSTNKSSTKRKGRESRTDKISIDSGKETENTPSGNSRKNQKDNCLPLGSAKTQGQDPLETQLSLTTDLLKSDSDNNNSDDCGNILPSDIMEFVLNTPSMQALGQQTEAPSAEPFSLDESYGVDVNQRKDMLFEDFTQPLASAEPGESGVNTSIAVEESFGLPLELPSDLSVLTTRSPTVNNQNHGSLISETSDRTILALATEESGVEKSGKKTRTGSTASSKSPQDRCADSQIPEGQMTPEHFISARIDGDHITSPGVAPAGETGNQDLTRNSSTPGLASSPTLPLQCQKFIPAATVSSGPAPIASSAVQAAASQLKPGPEKLIVLNQHLQPLYLLQTLPNGVTQKIQIAPSVSATGVMNTSAPVLTGLSGSISTSQSIFSAGGKGLVPVSHHPQIHAFTGTTQTGFQSVIPSTTSGLFIGVASHDPQIGVTEAGNRHDHASAPTMLPSGHGKKRLISRLQSNKSKKQARPKTQPTLAPSDVGPNMTLINLSPSQISAGIPTQSGLMELGTITATATPHRKIPNIIKRPKQGVMYLEPTLLPQPMPISTTTQPGTLGHDSATHLLPCTMSGLNPSQSVLNVVSVPPTAPGNFLGANSVSLSAPGLISSTEITGSISNLLFKANPHNLGLPEQQMVLHSGTPMMSHLTNPAQTSIASSICVFPQNQSISMSVNQQVEKEGSVHLQHPVSRVLADKNFDPNGSSTGQVTLAPNPITQDLNKSHVVGVLTQSSRTSPISRPPHQQQSSKLPAGAASTAIGKGKQKAKRPRPSPDKSSGKKRKGLQSDTPTVDTSAIQLSYFPGDRELSSPEPMDTGQDSGRDSSLDYKPKKGLIFEICSDDGFQIRCESIEEAWKSLTDKVQEARSNARLKALSFDGVNGLKMLGVVHDAVVFLLEQLYGARHCRNYRFRFHKPEEPKDPPVNPHGSARAAVYHRRSVLDMFNFLASKHRQPPVYNPQEEDEEEILQKSARRATSMDLPLPMRFRHLKNVSREAVGVYRSAIHGRGLFCKKNIDAGEMVIEYSGNVIRSVLTDKREKYYDSKGIGCYMFRINDYEVVDATMHGNAARFINHSCEPNCYSRVVNVDGQKHIVIFATRKIYKGEELTYDYKFPIEEPGNKLPCNCRAKKCRKFLN